MNLIRPGLSLLAIATFTATALFADPAAAIGLLVPSQPGVPALKLVSHRVEVDITERGARTRVTQEFDNPTGRQLEATYLFPMPKGASVDEFALWMNGKRETGKVMERKEARRIYESIVRRARDPGLIEYVDSELFQARVFPIPPNGRQKVELIYTNLVDYEGGLHRYVYPLKTDQRAAVTMNDFTLTVRVKNKLAIKNVYSPTHRVATQRKGNSAAASFEKHAFSLADDFVLYWSVDDADVGVTVLTHKEGDSAGYFMLLASPKDGYRDTEIIGKRLSLVVDTSGSMAGAKMEATKRALDYILSRLGGDDLFNVITFGGFVDPFSDRMQAASRGNIKKARDFVRQIEPLGGTNIDEAMQAALKGATGSKKAPHMIVFLTDGRPTVGETEVKKILSRTKGANAHNARVFVFGVGDDVNTMLLDKLAAENGGSSTYLAGDATVEGELKSFYDRVSHPVLSDLKLDVSGVRVFGTHPRRLGDLFGGGQLVVLGRYRGSGKASVKLSGTTPKGRRTFSYDASFARATTEHTFIPRLWAQRQVGMLLEQIREKGESKGLVDEVTQLATAFGIVTPYTSYLVLEPGARVPPRPDETRPRPMPRRAPVLGRGATGGPADDMDFGAFAPAAEEAEMAPPPASAKGGSGFRSAKPKKDSRSRKMLAATEGKSAVSAAKEIGRLRDSSVADKRRVATTHQRVGGAEFTYKGGVWVDGRCTKKDKVLVVKVYSKAWFHVLKRMPALKKAFALGEAVRVEARPGKCVEVAPSAKDVPTAKVDKFIGGR
jgi:Ca-activated chloride channel family protein